ncbi:NAD-binding protein [Halosimplex aquaticum]
MNDVLARPRKTMVVGTSREAQTLACRLAEDFDVTFVSDQEELLTGDRTADFDTEYAALDDGSDLSMLDLSVDAAVVAAGRDRINMLAAQHIRTRCDVDRLVVRVNDPSRESAFAALDAETICPTDVLEPAIRSSLDDS